MLAHGLQCMLSLRNGSQTLPHNILIQCVSVRPGMCILASVLIQGLSDGGDAWTAIGALLP